MPASIANLGGGFDTLGVAVRLYLRARVVDVRDDGGTRLVVTGSTPAVRGENALERAFALLARRTGRRTPTVSVEVTSAIPMAAGLGSSAAATVAGVRLFEAAAGPQPEGVLLAAATEVEGHADNAAAALAGGLVSVLQPESGDPSGDPIALRWTWPAGVRLVVATPGDGLPTATARAALAPQVSRADAVFNLQRVVALVHAFQAGRDDLVREAMRDRWHQPARAALVPLLREVLALDDPAVLGACLSGAGPSVAVLVRRDTARIEARLQALYGHAGRPVVVRTLDVHEGAGDCETPDAVASVHGRTV